jgi:hypothetical protein
MNSGCSMQFTFDTQDGLFPGVPPPNFPARNHPTTQIEIRVGEWPDNVFKLWLPEIVSELWANTTAEVARQRFTHTERGGLIWGFEQHPAASIEAELTPHHHSLALEVRVANCSRENLPQVVVMNCLHLAAAPDFACRDFSRIFIYAGGRWQSLAALNPTHNDPYYYRAGYFEAGGIAFAGGKLSHSIQAVEAQHPLIVCVSRDGRRCVGTASEDYQFLFHNQGNENLLCLHSQQSALAALSPGSTAIFRQKVYFVDGGLLECIAAFEQDGVGWPITGLAN